MDTSSNKRIKKSRNSIQDAKEFYEPWMEPGWQPTPSPVAPTPVPILKNRSNFKFHPDYSRESPLSLTRSPSSISLPMSSSADFAYMDAFSQYPNFKPFNFARFYRWVTNGRLTDLHLVRKMLFDE